MYSRHQRQIRDLFVMCSRHQSYLSCSFERLQQVSATALARFASVSAEKVPKLYFVFYSQTTRSVPISNSKLIWNFPNYFCNFEKPLCKSSKESCKSPYGIFQRDTRARDGCSDIISY